MISFIVIGKNEGWKLNKCFQSIQDTIDYNSIEKFEIFYIDSNSSDNSIEIVSAFSSVEICVLTGEANAAIARNLGAEISKGNILFFIDGDMEINKEIFNELFDEYGDLKHQFISGDFRNHYYDNSESKISSSNEMYHKNTETVRNYTTGGLFLIEKNVWKSIGGMRNVFFRSQDMDLGLRLAKNGIFLHRLPISLANHHTINYRSKNRMWVDLKNKNHLYARSLLYRKNIFNIFMYKVMLKQDYSFIILFLSIIGSIVFKKPEILFLYFLIILVRSYPRKHFKFVLYFLIRDVKVFLGLFFFYPSLKDISYKVMTKKSNLIKIKQ